MARRVLNVSMDAWVTAQIATAEIVEYETKMIVRMSTGLAATSVTLLRTKMETMARDHAETA